MAEYFYWLGEDFLITKEQQLAASTVVGLLLMVLNCMELSNNTLRNENQLLHDSTEKSEQQLGVLMEKKNQA